MSVVLIAVDADLTSACIGPFPDADAARQFANDHLALPPGMELTTTVEPLVSPEEFLSI